MSVKVEVLDKIMGSGKTEAMLSWMKGSSERFIYVTPLLSEVEARVGEEDSLDISFPQICKVNTTKGQSLLELLKGGGNIAAFFLESPRQRYSQQLNYYRKMDNAFMVEKILKAKMLMKIMKMEKQFELLF